MRKRAERKIQVDRLERGFMMGNQLVRPQAGELNAVRPLWRYPLGVRPQSQHIEPKAMRVLLALASRQGDFVSKNDLIDEVWDGRPVTDDALTHAVHSMRSALDDDPRDPKFIETRSNVGYRLLQAVRPLGVRAGHSYQRLVAGAVAAICLLFAAYVYLDNALEVPFDEAPTIAVLPFLNLSGEDDKDFLSDAMTEALILNLAHLSDFRVISRSSVMSFAGQNDSAENIARKLGADLLVEGSVQAVDGEVRVVAQLIEPYQDGHLWAGHFDRKLQDILALQQEVSSTIANRIGSVVSDDRASSQTVTRLLPESDLHDYLQARYWLAQGDVEGSMDSLRIFKHLANRFPDFPPAHLGQAQAGLFLFKAGQLDYTQLKQALNAALVYESQAGASSESQRCIGQILLLSEWNFDAAESHYRTSLSLNPSDTTARRRYAWLLVAQKRYEEAAGQIREIRLLDPLYYDNAEMATLLLYSGQIDAAVAEFERISSSTELSLAVLRGMAVAYLAAGEEDKARATLAGLLAKLDGPVTRQSMPLDNLSIDDLYQVVIEAQPFHSQIAIAGFHNLAGDPSAALDALEQAVQQRDPFALYLGAMPELASLHGHPRFMALLSRIGVSPENPDHLLKTRLFSSNLRNPQETYRDN